MTNKLLSWIDQSGFPIIEVMDSKFNSNNEAEVKISYRRYYESGDIDNDETKWFIPL